jgi:hypothetical protein
MKRCDQCQAHNNSASETTGTVVQLTAAQAKLLRRIQHLTPGRHELLITVGDGQEKLDWSVRSWGKVER